MDMNDVFDVVNNEMAAHLCLSSGGWEGWLQCELWSHLVSKGDAAEREVSYPDPYNNLRCDLVSMHKSAELWVEIKAFGIFRQGDEQRFLDAIARDVMKLDARPANTYGLALVVVPKAILGPFMEALKKRRWNGFGHQDSDYVAVFSLWIERGQQALSVAAR